MGRIVVNLSRYPFVYRSKLRIVSFPDFIPNATVV